MHESRKSLMFLQPKTWNLIGKPSYRSLTFTQEYYFQCKFFFCDWQIMVWSHHFSRLAGSNYKNYLTHSGQGKQKVNCSELYLELTLLGLWHIVKGCLWNMAKSTRKSELHPLTPGLSARAPLRDARQANLNFTLSSYNKDNL